MLSRFFCFAILFLVSFQVSAYTDQIVIETPNMAKTVYDIRVHALIRHLYESKSVIDPLAANWMASSFENERANFVQQYLAQNYVVENDLNLKPSPSEVQQAVKVIEQVFKSDAEKKKVFSPLGVTPVDIQQWVTHKLTFEKFVVNTIQNRVIITDDKLNTHYQTWKSKRFSDKKYDDVKQKVHDDLTQSLLKDEFEKWIDQEKRREKMILKVVTPS